MNYKPLANWDAPPSNSYSRGSWHIKKKKLKLHGCIRYTNIYEPLFYWGPPFTWFEQPILNRCCTFVCLCMSLLAMYLSSCMSYIILYLHDIFFSMGLESSSSHQALEHSWPTWPFQESSGQRTASARELSAAWIPSDSCSLLLEQMTIWLVVWNMVFIFHNIWIYIYRWDNPPTIDFHIFQMIGRVDIIWLYSK